ncbi:MAG: hypothetical protein M5U19_18740 [Microthrixaceae bacterium]|nr:hypothetical protein [Microthrixaceae bacterium]
MTETTGSPSPAHGRHAPQRGSRRSPWRRKRHAAAISRIAASGVAAATTAALVAVLGAQSRAAGNTAVDTPGSPEVPTSAGVAQPEQTASAYAGPPPPVTAAPAATEPVTQSSES